MNCPNCNKKLTCGCQKAKASDGAVVCKSCKYSYEKSLSETNKTNVENLQKFVK
jgi:transcription elongation factor Elf1